MHVNLLPTSFVWQRLIRKRLRQWACAFGFAAIAFVGANAPLLAQWWLDLREFQAMHLAAEPVIAMQAERMELVKKTTAIQHEIKHIQSITMQDHSSSILGTVASSVSSASGVVQIQEMQVAVAAIPTSTASSQSNTPSNSNPIRSNLSKEEKPPAIQYHLTLKGIAIESEAISTFVGNLEKSGVFPKVELRSMQERVVLDRAIQEFQLESFVNE